MPCRTGLFRSLQLRAKSKMCANTEIICHEEFCPYAKEYGIKLVRSGLLKNLLDADEHQDPDRIFESAKEHEVCPFEVSLDLLADVDLVVCDYNYVFDPTIGLSALAGGDASARRRAGHRRGPQPRRSQPRVLLAADHVHDAGSRPPLSSKPVQTRCSISSRIWCPNSPGEVERSRGRKPRRRGARRRPGRSPTRCRVRSANRFRRRHAQLFPLQERTRDVDRRRPRPRRFLRADQVSPGVGARRRRVRLYGAAQRPRRRHLEDLLPRRIAIRRRNSRGQRFGHRACRRPSSPSSSTAIFWVSTLTEPKSSTSLRLFHPKTAWCSPSLTSTRPTAVAPRTTTASRRGSPGCPTPAATS